MKSVFPVFVLLLCVIFHLPDASALEWGAQKEKLTTWTFGNYKNVNATDSQIAGTTVCEYGVISPFLYSPAFQWQASADDALVIQLKSSQAGSGQLLFKKDPKAAYNDALKIKFFTPGGDGEWHTLIIPLRHNQWKDAITNLRLAFLYEDKVDIAIRSISLVRFDQADRYNILYNGSMEIPGVDNQPYRWQIQTRGTRVDTGSSGRNGTRGLTVNGKGTAKFTPPMVYLDFLEKGTDKLLFSFAAQAGQPGKMTARFQLEDALEKELDIKEFTWNLAAGGDFVEYSMPEFSIPLNTMRAKAVFTFENSGGMTSLDDFRIRQSVQAADPSEWLGEWIRPSADLPQPSREMYFRKHFELPADLKSAYLAVNGDNFIGSIYINGKMLPAGVNAKAYNVPDLHRIDSFLQPGKNVLAIHASNYDLLGGVIAELTAYTKDNRKISIGSGADWQSAAQKEDNWFQVDFNDEKWAMAHSLGKGDATLFGKMAKPFQEENGIISILDFKLEAVPGSPVEYEYEIGYKAELTGPVELALLLDGAQKGQPKNFKLVHADIRNGEQRIKGKIQLPDFLPAGDYQVKVAGSTTLENTLSRPLSITLAGPRKSDSAIPVIDANGAGALRMGSESMNLIHHWCGATREMTEELLGNCRDNQLNLYFANPYSNWGWRPDGKHDFSAIDQFCYRLLEVDPQGRIVIWIAIDSYHNPELRIWLESNPAESAAKENGDTVMKRIHSGVNIKVISPASRKWKEEMTQSLQALARHIKSSAYGHRVAGLHPISGMGGEWYMWGTFDTGGGVERLDYSEPFRNGFVEYIIKKYGSLEKINQRWKSNYQHPSEIVPPSVAERDKSDYFGFLDPQKSARTIDFREYISDLVAGNVIAMCDAIKKGSEETMLAGAFYGYINYVVEPTWSESGHFALGKILDSNRVDYLTHLLRYDNRGAGDTGGFMTPENSFLLHGKIPFVQADIRTHRLDAQSPDAVYSRCNNLQESIAVIKRDFSNALMNGVGYEFGYFGRGWIAADRRMMEVVGRCKEIEEEIRRIGCNRFDTDNSIAVIVDDISTYFTAQSSPIHRQLVKTQMPLFNRSGSGLDTYLLADIDRIPEYSCYVFLNTFRITKEQQEIINRRLKRDNKTLVWVYAPGVVNENSLQLEQVQNLTGIRMKVMDSLFSAKVKITGPYHPILKYLRSGDTYGSGGNIGPLFVPQEGIILGRTVQGDHPALAVKKFPDYTVCYSSIPGLSAELLRGIAYASGAHVANEQNGDSTYLGDNLLAIHSSRGGKRTLTAPRKYRRKAIELFSGREYPLENGVFEVELEPMSTVLFRME